jgi:hypothetical protein
LGAIDFRTTWDLFYFQTHCIVLQKKYGWKANTLVKGILLERDHFNGISTKESSPLTNSGNYDRGGVTLSCCVLLTTVVKKVKISKKM